MITAIVPARSGSKRLPGKNVKLLGGKPLIFHTLDAVTNQQAVSKVIFTTDSDEYLGLVNQKYGDEVTLEKRPESFASDTTKVHDEIVRLAKTGQIQTEWFMLCLPTAPLRTYSTVSRLLAQWSTNGDPLFSASEYNFPIQFAFSIDLNGDWQVVDEKSPMLTGNTRSQDIEKRFRPNGAIYLQKTENLFKNLTFYMDAKPFLISERESTDVDTELDFLIAELLISGA